MSTGPRRLRLGFAGTPEFAVAALDALAEAHGICAVFTQPDRPAGRGRSLHASPVKSRAAELTLPVYQPASFKSPEALQILRGLDIGGEPEWMAAIREANKRRQQDARELNEDEPG